jgi:non-ribosomal peptide synthetase component F
VALKCLEWGLTARLWRSGPSCFGEAVWTSVLWCRFTDEPPYSGGSLFVVDEETKLQPPKLIAFLARHGITQCGVPTPIAEALLSEPITPSLRLRNLYAGGDKLHRGLDEEAPPPPFRFFNLYGPTEATVMCTAYCVGPGRDPPPIGKPNGNTLLYVVDPNLSPVPIGVPGELLVGGVGVTRWGAPGPGHE